MKQLEAQTLKALLERANWDSLGDVVEERTFEGMPARRIYGILSALHEVTDRDLTEAMVYQHIDATYHLKLNIKDELIDEMRFVGACDSPDNGVLRFTIGQMIRRSKSLEAANYVSMNIDSPDFDPNIPLALYQRAADMEVAMDTDVMEYRTAPPPSDGDRAGIVGTGLHPEIDTALGGGTGIGEVLVMLSPSGHGKTSHLCWMGATALKAGKNVLHISCEDHAYKVRGRYDSCFTTYTADELLKYPQKVMEARNAVQGNLYIQDWSSREVRASDVRSLVMRLEKMGRPVDTVIVDYLGKMSADAKMWDGARPYGKITCELRRVANECQFRCYTGWQTNKQGWHALLLSVDDVADDVGVYRECDGMIGININREQLKAKKCIHNVIKSRGGTARPAKIHNVDMDRMNFFNAVDQVKEIADLEGIA